MRVPLLETARLVVRPFTLDDLDAIYLILDVELGDAGAGTEGTRARDERRRWLQWTVLNYEELVRLYQPPYGDRAVTLKETGQLIGACGFVPCLAPFGQLPGFGAAGGDASAATARLTSTEFGLFYAIAPACRRRGYAAEAAGALIGYAFTRLRLGRIVATTSYDNAASMGVMRRLGMRIERNPYPDPPWLQVVGVLENPRREFPAPQP